MKGKVKIKTKHTHFLNLLLGYLTCSKLRLQTTLSILQFFFLVGIFMLAVLFTLLTSKSCHVNKRDRHKTLNIISNHKCKPKNIYLYLCIQLRPMKSLQVLIEVPNARSKTDSCTLETESNSSHLEF